MATLPEYEVWGRNRSLERIDILDAWLSLTVVLRFNGVGTGELELARTMPGAALLDIDGGLIIRRDGTTIFSGRVTSRTRTATTITFGLVDDTALLETAARPTPALAEGPFPDADYVHTATASTTMLALVDAQIGPSAPAAWRVTGLTLGTDHGLGAEVTVRARLDPIITVLQQLAASPMAGGLRFWIAQSDDDPDALAFNVAAVRDRSVEAVFSVETETAADHEDTYEAGGPNYIYVMLGDGFGENRTILEAGDAAAILAAGRRITEVVDIRGTTNTGEGQQHLAERLAQVGTSRRVRITPQDVPSLTYGDEYDLGDLVTVVIDGESFVEVVREIELSLTTNRGAIAIPTVNGDGTSADDGTPEGRIARHIATVQDRLGNIERNWTTPDDSTTNAMLHPTVKWSVGDVKQALRATAQLGWLVMAGQSVSKTTYAALWAHFQSEGFTFGSDLNTFVIPDMRERYPLGAGGATSLGEIGGADTATVELPAHSHEHSHGGGTLVYNHSHPGGEHDHEHDHPVDPHVHDYDIDHDHPSVDTGGADTDSVAIGRDEPGGGAEDHHHVVNVPAYTASKTTEEGDKSGGGAFTSTQSDATNSGSYNTGNQNPGATWMGGTDPDATEAGGGESEIAIQPPFLALSYFIFAGA